MKSVIAKIKKYHLNPQILNTLRFSAQRYDTSRSDSVPGKNFKDLYRHINIRMTRPDEKVFFDFLMLHGPSTKLVSPDSSSAEFEPEFKNRAIFNLKQLDKIIDFFAKEFYGQMQEKNQNAQVTSTEQRQLQRKS